jgi:SPP1 family predicted phage head-tail adaptor
MNAGQLRYRIILQTYAAATNANTGQSVRTWSDSETIWADVEWRTGTESEKNDIITQTQKTDFLIRYRTAVNANDYRIKFDDNVYDIESVEQVDAFRTWMKLGCKKRDNQ